MMKYLGGGFLEGVPARDLTDEEVQKFGERYLVQSGLYKADDKEVKHGNQGVTQNKRR